MGLTLGQLLPDYTASLNNATSVFGELNSSELTANLTRHLATSARKLALGKRPRTKQGMLQLVAGQSMYADVPTDLLLPKVSLWALQQREPWCLPHGPLPIFTLSESEGARVLMLNPPPSAEQIGVFGAAYPYYYFAAHAITTDPATSTLQEKDYDLVILGAQVEAMRETALRNAHKPVSLGQGSAGGSATRNMTPAALYTQLLDEWNAAA